MTAAASDSVSAVSSDDKKDDATTVDSTAIAPAPQLTSDPQAEKKKRGARRQLTKDDDNEDDDDAVDPRTRGESFQRADAATLAQRRIVKVKRPATTTATAGTAVTDGGESQEDKGETSTTTTTKSNPFANALSGFGSTTAMTSNTGFSGFRFNATSAGAGNTSTFPTTMTNSSTTSSTANNNTPASGTGFLSFGAAAASGAPTLGFGAAFGSSSKFGGAATTIKFGFANTSVATGAAPATALSSSTTAAGTLGEESASSSNSINLLPSDAEVTNGEEGEEFVFETRSKSFQLVTLEDANDDDNLLSKNSIPPTVTMSVPPSSAGAPSTTAPKSIDEKADKEDGKTDGNDGKVDPEENSTSANDKESSETKQQQQRWSELGIGPLRVLRHRQSRKARVVQRRENAAGGQGTKLLLNTVLNANSKLTRPSDKHVQLVTVGTRQGAAASFLFKVRNPADAKLLEGALQEVIDSADEAK
jgi:hypothetical protein